MATEKIAIVTGGGSGIGLAIAEKFTGAGIRTIIVGRDEQKLRQAKETLGGLCEVAQCDVGDLPSIPPLVKGIAEKWDRVDVLVNNAGINQKKDFTEVSDEEFQRVVQTNLSAVFSLSREVVKSMLAKGIKGSIINISSMAAQYGLPRVIAYSATKTAVEGLTRAMSTELSPKGIRTNCIAPGFIVTDMTDKALNSDPERKAKALNRTPIGYMGEPGDIGEAALFLASDAAKYITGVVLRVDGGNSVGF